MGRTETSFEIWGATALFGEPPARFSAEADPGRDLPADPLPGETARFRVTITTLVALRDRILVDGDNAIPHPPRVRLPTAPSTRNSRGSVSRRAPHTGNCPQPRLTVIPGDPVWQWGEPRRQKRVLETMFYKSRSHLSGSTSEHIFWHINGLIYLEKLI